MSGPNIPRFLSKSTLQTADAVIQNTSRTNNYHEQQLSTAVHQVLAAHPRANKDHVTRLLEEYQDASKVIAELNKDRPQLPTHLQPLALSLEEENAILKKSFINLHRKLKAMEQERETLKERLRRVEEENDKMKEVMRRQGGNLI